MKNLSENDVQNLLNYTKEWLMQSSAEEMHEKSQSLLTLIRDEVKPAWQLIVESVCTDPEEAEAFGEIVKKVHDLPECKNLTLEQVVLKLLPNDKLMEIFKH